MRVTVVDNKKAVVYSLLATSAGKLRKLWDSLSELCSCLCERRLERTILRPELLPVKTAQFTQLFP